MTRYQMVIAVVLLALPATASAQSRYRTDAQIAEDLARIEAYHRHQQLMDQLQKLQDQNDRRIEQEKKQHDSGCARSWTACSWRTP